MKILHELEKQALEGGVGKVVTGKAGKDTTELSTEPGKIIRLFKPSDKGCDICNHTGYKGRIGIYEVLANSEKLQKLIVNNSTSDELQRQAITEGMLTMQIDGFVKALRGQTSVEEILRVTSES